ncbi:hypothetical protein D3C71_1319480 [compost metagenome]
MGGVTEQVAVPDVGQRMQYRQVLRQRRGQRVLVHLRGTGQQLLEALEADRQRDREADRRPQRIAPAHPVPHRQHAAGGDRKGLRGAFGVGTDRIQSLAAAQPVVQDLPVEQGFLGAKGLGDQDAGRGGRVQRGQRALHGRAIHVGDEMHAEARTTDRAQRVGHQARAQVRAADADADDIGDAGLFQRGDQRTHLRAHLRGRGKGVAGHRGTGKVAAQRGVQRGAAFGQVDRFTAEQALEAAGDIALGGQLQQRVQRSAVVFLPREVGVQRTDPQSQRSCPLRFGGEQRRDARATQALGMGVKRVESVVLCHAAWVGMLSLVWEIWLLPSTYTNFGRKLSASSSLMLAKAAMMMMSPTCTWRAAPPLSETTPLPASARMA